MHCNDPSSQQWCSALTMQIQPQTFGYRSAVRNYPLVVPVLSIPEPADVLSHEVQTEPKDRAEVS